jgi:PAS domain S-box-containing protein
MEESRATIELSPDLILRFGPDLRYRYVNHAVALATGVATDAYIGCTIADIAVTSGAVNSWELCLRQVFRTATEQSFDFSLVTPRGEREFHMRAVPELGTDSRVQSVLAICRDLTELRRADVQRAELFAELAERERRLHTLLGKVLRAHEDELKHVAAAAAAEHLTPRERQILRFLAAGRTNREIGRELHISSGTVKNHVARLLPKLGVVDRTQAAVRAVELELLASGDR